MNNHNRIITASFHDTVVAGANKTLVSNRIDLPFTTKRIRAAFAPGVNRTLRLFFFISPDADVPTTHEPGGTNILAQLGPQRYIVGEDCVVDFVHETGSLESGKYLKVYAENTDAFDHTIDVQITVEIIPRENIKE